LVGFGSPRLQFAAPVQFEVGRLVVFGLEGKIRFTGHLADSSIAGGGREINSGAGILEIPPIRYTMDEGSSFRRTDVISPLLFRGKTMPFINNQGTRIHYRVEGQGKPLFLHHWSLGTLDDWYEYGFVDALAGEYRLILLDARGHGQSDKPHALEAYSLQNRVSDITAVLDDLQIPKAFYFGYSMGGWVGYGLALHAPHRFHALVIGGQHPYAQGMQELREVIQIGIDEGVEIFIDQQKTEFGAVPPQREERMRAFDFEALMAVTQDRASLEFILPRISIPCLLIVGEQDEVRPLVKKCAQVIPDNRLITLPGTDHIGVLSQADAVIPHIRQFLSQVN
jgi:pimeloyl-ACP methyl ester carboxylesterase